MHPVCNPENLVLSLFIENTNFGQGKNLLTENYGVIFFYS